MIEGNRPKLKKAGLLGASLLMTTDAEDLSATKRRLILRDSVTFLSLTLITVVLFAVTLFLFRSFEEHRAELAKRWADRGQAALQAGQPQQAIGAYRTALSYAPSERSYELQLARALGAAGQTEESYNYFMGLWETQPGDGFINLQLARLAVTKRDTQEAIHFYRSSIYGTWEGDGVERRREVRLELAKYLINQHEPGLARTELLVAGGNAPNTVAIDVTLAKLLEDAAGTSDALTFYQRAIALEPKNLLALQGAGRLAYAMGDYATARRLLERAVREDSKDQDDVKLLAQAERLIELAPSETLPARERVERILAARAIAKKRLDGCTAGAVPPSLQALAARWQSTEATASRAALLQDSDKQTAALHLVYDTEMETSQSCTAPEGDDALLLLLAQSARTAGR